MDDEPGEIAARIEGILELGSLARGYESAYRAVVGALQRLVGDLDPAPFTLEETVLDDPSGRAVRAWYVLHRREEEAVTNAVDGMIYLQRERATIAVLVANRSARALAEIRAQIEGGDAAGA